MTAEDIASIFLDLYPEMYSDELGLDVFDLENLMKASPGFYVECLGFIFENCKNDEQIAYFAAGVLENFFSYYPEQAPDLIIPKARKSKLFKSALTGVWHSSGPAKIALDKCLSAFNLSYGCF